MCTVGYKVDLRLNEEATAKSLKHYNEDLGRCLVPPWFPPPHSFSLLTVLFLYLFSSTDDSCVYAQTKLRRRKASSTTASFSTSPATDSQSRRRANNVRCTVINIVTCSTGSLRSPWSVHLRRRGRQPRKAREESLCSHRQLHGDVRS